MYLSEVKLRLISVAYIFIILHASCVGWEILVRCDTLNLKILNI